MENKKTLTKKEYVEKYGYGIERANIDICDFGTIIITPNYPGSRYDGSKVSRWYPGMKRTPEQVLRRCGFDPSIIELLGNHKEVSIYPDGEEVVISYYA